MEGSFDLDGIEEGIAEGSRHLEGIEDTIPEKVLKI
jgi:hypothetical protein